MLRKRDIMFSYHKESCEDRFEFLYEHYYYHKTVLSSCKACTIYSIEGYMCQEHWDKYFDIYNLQKREAFISKISDSMDKGESIDYLICGEGLPQSILEHYKDYIPMRIDFRIFSYALKSIGGKDEELIRRYTEKVHGTRNEYRQVYKEDCLVVDGLHEALVSEEVWEQAQAKVLSQAKKYEKVNRDKGEKIHLLSDILRCPVCVAGMYGNKAIKKRKDGSKYKDFFYYGCKHRNMTRGHKCDYKKQIHEELLDAAVAEAISKMVSNQKFSKMIRSKIDMEVDTSTLDQEIANYEKQLRQLYHNKDSILADIDGLDYEDKHYKRRKTDLENHLYKTYDKIEETEESLVSAKAKKRSLMADKITGDNIYKALIFFDKL